MIDPKAPDYSNTPASDRRPVFGYRPEDASAAPLVSIVTPFYSAGEQFHETARAILGQSFQQWEWIIVNDASPHAKAAEVLSRYRQGDARVRVVDHPQNKGLPAARNTGFEQARSEYVYIVDDDDLIEPTTVEKSLWHLVSHPEFALANAWSVAFGARQYLWPEGFNHGERFLKENMAVNRSLIRRRVWREVGGFDESMRSGMEDWEFWLRCANHGQWGATIPEYLDWYRTRPDPGDRWATLRGDEPRKEFLERMAKKYPRIYEGQFPKITPRWHQPFETIRTDIPVHNRLAKDRPRVLMILPWMQLGGADKVTLDIVEQLARRGWETSIIATRPGDDPWAPRFARWTPDIFNLHNFLRMPDFPAFIRYFIESRRPDVVMITASEFAQMLLPYLRTFCPGPAYVDFCHAESYAWKNGGHARYAAANQDWLELNLVTSEHLKRWMMARGAKPDRIEVVYVNVDPEEWKPDAEGRRRVREELTIPRDAPVIIFAGRLHSDKQPRVLAEVLRRVAQSVPACHAIIAGDGDDEDWLKGFVQDHHLVSRLHLVGAVAPARVRELMQAADIFFLPSIWEGIALSIYEAMACELAVVGADVGGQKELLTPECGTLLPRSDESGEVAAYTRVLEGLLRDPLRRRAMGVLARERILAGFTLDQMGERVERLLRSAAGERRRPVAAHLTPGQAIECANLAVEHTRLSEDVDSQWRQAHGAISRHADLLRRYNELHEWTETLNARYEERVAELRRTWDRCCELDQQRAANNDELRWLRERCAALERIVGGGESSIDHALNLERAIADIHRSRAWRLAQLIKRVGRSVVPRGSMRERVCKWCAGLGNGHKSP